jgi:hypothetical protein
MRAATAAAAGLLLCLLLSASLRRNVSGGSVSLEALQAWGGASQGMPHRDGHERQPGFQSRLREAAREGSQKRTRGLVVWVVSRLHSRDFMCVSCVGCA